jgi:hypothetical protein
MSGRMNYSAAAKVRVMYAARSRYGYPIPKPRHLLLHPPRPAILGHQPPSNAAITLPRIWGTGHVLVNARGVVRPRQRA